MRIYEILHWNNNLDLHFRPGASGNDLTNLANAFTRDGRVKHLWKLNGSDMQPSGPAPPNAEPELIPNGTLEPTAAYWQPQPVETEPEVGQYRLVPIRRYRDPSGD